MICGFVSEVVSRESNETNSRQTHRPNRPRQDSSSSLPSNISKTSPSRVVVGSTMLVCGSSQHLRYPLLSPVASSLICTTLPPVLPPSTVPLLLKSELPTLADTRKAPRSDRVAGSPGPRQSSLKHSEHPSAWRRVLARYCTGRLGDRAESRERHPGGRLRRNCTDRALIIAFGYFGRHRQNWPSHLSPWQRAASGQWQLLLMCAPTADRRAATT